MRYIRSDRRLVVVAILPVLRRQHQPGRQLLLAHRPAVLLTRQRHQRRRGVTRKIQKPVIHVVVRSSHRDSQRRLLLRGDPIGGIGRYAGIEFVFHGGLRQEPHGFEFFGIGRRIQRGGKSKEERGGVRGFGFGDAISSFGWRWRWRDHADSYHCSSSSSCREERLVGTMTLSFGSVGTGTPFESEHDVSNDRLALQIGETLRRLLVGCKIQEGVTRRCLPHSIHFRFRKSHRHASKGPKRVHQDVHRQRHARISVQSVKEQRSIVGIVLLRGLFRLVVVVVSAAVVSPRSFSRRTHLPSIGPSVVTSSSSSSSSSAPSTASHGHRRLFLRDAPGPRFRQPPRGYH
ncbi:hypothetical protein ACHAXS_012809 [Conticribra weissflogii]